VEQQVEYEQSNKWSKNGTIGRARGAKQQVEQEVEQQSGLE
jgi:hypothetical protein